MDSFCEQHELVDIFMHLTVSKLTILKILYFNCKFILCLYLLASCVYFTIHLLYDVMYIISVICF